MCRRGYRSDKFPLSIYTPFNPSLPCTDQPSSSHQPLAARTKHRGTYITSFGFFPFPSCLVSLPPPSTLARYFRLLSASLFPFLVILLIFFIVAPPLRLFSPTAHSVNGRLSQLLSQLRAGSTKASSISSTTYRPLAYTSSSSINPTATLTAARSLTTASMAPTAFRRPPQAPPVFTATPESIKRDTQALIDQARNAIDELVKEFDPATSSKNPTFENVMVPQLDHENQMSLSNRILGFYSSVATDAKLRDVSSESEQLMEEYSIEISMRDDMFQIVKAVYEKEKENRTIDDVDFRILEKDYKAYLRMGLGLPPGPKRDRFKEIKLRLSEIQIQFQKNLNEESNALWFTREELDGFPEDLLETLKVGTEEDGAENVGKHRLTFKYPELFPALKYIKNSETRRKVFVANEKKIPENIALFKEAITLRSEGSRLLGFPNHAVFRLEDKMAKTPEHVNAFLGDLHKRLTPGAKAELAKLKQLKSEDLKSRGLESQDDGHYYLWDHRFYDRLLVEKEYSIDHQTISEYFPIQTTIRGMLEIFEQLFGLQFIELKTKEERDAVAESGNGEDIVWHEDVQLFSVWNDGGEGGEFVGYLYLDLFPRVGKYSHAANFNLQPVRPYETPTPPPLFTITK